MEEKSEKKKKKRTFLEDLFYSMMVAVMTAAINNIFDTVFGDLFEIENKAQWIDELMQEPYVMSLMDEAVDELYQNYNDTYLQ